MSSRRRFLADTFGATVLASLPASLLADDVLQTGASPAGWDAGQVRHLLPTVSDTEILIKASFIQPLSSPPSLRLGTTAVRGAMNDTAGEFWQFHATGLQPGRLYTLALVASNGRPLCATWVLSTFPPRDSQPERFRVLFFTCAGGHEALAYLPAAVRQRLLRRALSLQPDAAVANGDHVYWDLLSPAGGPRLGSSAEARKISGSFDRSALVFGTTNETVLKRAATPQIAPVYGTAFRSTPVFFVQDDHDYFENDEATDEIITFPPSGFMMQLARATQKMFYPEFLRDQTRPAGLPWSGSGDRDIGLSESFGTIRFGRLAEILLYDVRRTLTLAGPSAVFIDREAERWLIDRTSSGDSAHLVHVPSNPPGWSAGKWGEWYPDILGSDGKLTTAVTKPYWQRGWLAQHDRIIGALGARRDRIPLVISGDLHAIGAGTISRCGAAKLANPVNAVLSGPIGTNPTGWPSGRRGIGPTVPAHLDLKEEISPLEQHGFTLVDFLADRIELQFFKWKVGADAESAIDTLASFHRMVLNKT